MSMTEQRKTARLHTLAKVDVEGHEEERTLLKDISVTGCGVICPIDTKIELNTKYKLEITPEKSAKIDIFDFFAESKWIKTSAKTFEMGFTIVDPPKGEQFRRYVDYLSWRYSRGNSITGENSVRIFPFG